jgi:hypothetical protein
MAHRLRSLVLFLLAAALAVGMTVFAGDPVLRTGFEWAAVVAFVLAIF